MKRVIFLCWALLLFQSKIYSNSNDSIEVIIFLSETCPICKNQTTTLNQIYSENKSKGIAFVGWFPDVVNTTPESIRAFQAKYKIAFELKLDDSQKVANQLNATTTPQVFVRRKKTGEILYSGKVDNGFESIGRRRQVITAHYLSDALKNILLILPIAIAETSPVGCFIQKPKFTIK